jgi:heme o synthase
MKSKFIIKFSDFLTLSKLKIMIPVSLTGFTGYFVFKSGFSLQICLTTLGILMLAISASVLNQIQEADIDIKMRRTQNRPIPSGKITIQEAFIFFSFALISGLILIITAGNLKAALIGVMTIFWYNGIYTYLKRVTAFAVVPGAITGALPPLIGWVAAGGAVLDKPILFIEFLFFVGQVPHFWLLIMKYGEEYENAGIPSLTSILSRPQINRLTFTWVVTSVVSALLLCHFGIIKTVALVGILTVASLIIIWQFSALLKVPGKRNNYIKFSLLLDSYFLLLLILLISDRIIS